jgi:hypothetical protein
MPLVTTYLSLTDDVPTPEIRVDQRLTCPEHPPYVGVALVKALVDDGVDEGAAGEFHDQGTTLKNIITNQ